MRGARPHKSLERAVVHAAALRKGERTVIACSGGPDSVALAAVLHELAHELRLELSLAHVNHGLRASARQDECVAMRIAATFELPLDVVGIAAGKGGEAQLREARYAALLEIAQRRKASALATAHHAEDQSETVLLALFRGSGPEGLAGIAARRPLGDGIDLVRPLLRVTSEELREYCHLNGLPYAVDPTNQDQSLRRNAVRQALDALRPAFPGLDEAVARAAELVGSERTSAPRAALRGRVREALREQKALADVDFEHVEAAVRALENGRTGRFHMRTGLTLRIEAGGPTVIKTSED
jgi:tRNA(Ile)-lysidine synthase